MAIIENIYYSLKFNENYNDWIEKNRDKFTDNLKLAMGIEEHFLFETVEIIQGIKRYPYGYSVREKFRIFFSNKCGDNYPVYVIISAMYLHTNTVWECLLEVQRVCEQIILYYDKEIILEDSKWDFKFSRLDICNHNNFVHMDEYIKSNEYNSRTVTRSRLVRPVIRLNGENDQETNYFRYGDGDVVVRFYNKVREVCEMQYKGFFFKRWLDEGLIDKKTFDIYDYAYKLNNNYRVDFMFANIYFSKIDDKLKLEANDLYKDLKIDHTDKYESFKSIIKKHKIKVAVEITNVEYQLRGGFFTHLKIEDLEKNIIDYTDIFSILLNADTLYRYITSDVFRVVTRDSKCETKRKKPTDALWVLIQNSRVLNISDMGIDKAQLKVYREYNTELNTFMTTKKVFKNATHLMYTKMNEVDYDTPVEAITVLSNAFDEYQMNENFFNVRDLMDKQVCYYGKKSFDKDTN
jgi:hypothetical protein